MKAAPRNEQEVFEELASLCALPGYVHALAYLSFRDNMVGFGKTLTTEDLLESFSKERLIRTEMSTLIGLLVRGSIDFSEPSSELFKWYVDQSDKLLAEIHDAMSHPVWADLIAAMTSGEKPDADILSRGSALREPIFYGAESAYNFQYRDIAPQKYAADNAWLKQHKGFTIELARDVVEFLGILVSAKLSELARPLRGMPFQPCSCLRGFTFKASEIAEALNGQEAEITKILEAFSLPADTSNEVFTSLSAFNVTNATPILRVTEDVYLLLQPYSLCEALYDSPFYWMVADQQYQSKAMAHRGAFTESFSTNHLKTVFGDRNVFTNVQLVGKSGEVAGEIDVLVVYGNRAIVLQAKSKKLTIAARKGNDQQIRDDFKKSVQDSYDQAESCTQLLIKKQHSICDANRQPIKLRTSSIKTFYLLCVVADHYPALSFQSRQFLKAKTTDVVRPPFVLDIFTLDAITEMLSTPLRLLSYIDRRAFYDERLHAGHELTILSYHLKQNLWLDSQYDMVSLDDDISVDLDVAMLVRREGAPGERTPKGILTRLEGTKVGSMLEQIERRPDPNIIDFGFMLLTLSGDSLGAIERGIETVTRLSQKDGKTHDFSLGLQGGASGLTIHSTDADRQVAGIALARHCESRKYAQRARTWFGLCVSPRDGSLRFGINFDSEWKVDQRLEDSLLNLKPPKKVQIRNGRLYMSKVGRNELCPCDSGQKYKKCCLRRMGR